MMGGRGHLSPVIFGRINGGKKRVLDALKKQAPSESVFLLLTFPGVSCQATHARDPPYRRSFLSGGGSTCGERGASCSAGPTAGCQRWCRRLRSQRAGDDRRVSGVGNRHHHANGTSSRRGPSRAILRSHRLPSQRKRSLRDSRACRPSCPSGRRQTRMGRVDSPSRIDSPAPMA